MKTRRSKHKGKKGNAGNAKTVGKQIKTSGKKAKMKEKQAKKPAGSKQTDNVIAKGPEERFNAVWPWMVSRVCAFCMLCLCAVSVQKVYLYGIVFHGVYFRACICIYQYLCLCLFLPLWVSICIFC